MQLGGDAVVVADEQSLQGSQLDVFVAAHVAGHKQVAGGHGPGVVGHVDQGELAWSEIGAVVIGQHVAGAGLEQAADVRAQGVCERRRRTVHLRQVEE